MLRLIVLLFSIIQISACYAQGDSLEWKELRQFEIGKNEVWNVDILQNVYLTKKNLLKKYDSTGVLKFSQSIRSVGRLSGIEPLNFMKILVFSDEQQSVCWLDNTLTLGDKCLDLNEMNFKYAYKVAVSGQPDKLWIVDQVNWQLRLVTTSNSNQTQEVKNLKGVTEIQEVTKMMEYGNELFLLDKNIGIYRFDLYGALLEHIPVEGGEDLGFWNGHLLYLKNDQMHVIDLKNALQSSFSLPVKGIKEFRISDKLFYLRTEQKVINYRVSLAN